MISNGTAGFQPQFRSSQWVTVLPQARNNVPLSTAATEIAALNESASQLQRADDLLT
ncbi:hypothetical protein JYU34_008915 [Plutella xylostella]|uniref:Uncharacterized protein n=1 Tax=Plutella xylostella TaxID=51655 RepID=A0ABQ7QM54_PLUXY|nr:hypothetical protein JYU34_008915 [Plutella xylostella]